MGRETRLIAVQKIGVGKLTMRKQFKKICLNCNEPFTTIRKNQKCCSIACDRELRKEQQRQEISKIPIIQTWACGGGVQSTAIAVLITLGELPKPDYAYMVDCGYEKTKTMNYVNEITIPKLQKVGVTLNIIKGGGPIIDTNQYILIPAYGNENGNIRKYPTFCNDNWKVVPSKRWLREQGIERCDNWIGMSWDEEHRKRISPLWWIQNKYPLCDMKLTRWDCTKIIRDNGWPMAPRSSCLMCPLQDDNAWFDMKRNWKEDWERAISIEREIQKVKPNTYLHRSCKPLDEVDFKIMRTIQREILF